MQKPFVLVVEDDAQLRSVIVTNLRAHGCVALEAADYAQALDKLAIKPQLMILDIFLPDGSGWDVAEWAEDESVSVPTIVISAAQPDRRRLAHFTSASFLPKPFDMRKLMGLVDACLGTH